jgi:hypothetical protein
MLLIRAAVAARRRSRNEVNMDRCCHIYLYMAQWRGRFRKRATYAFHICSGVSTPKIRFTSVSAVLTGRHYGLPSETLYCRHLRHITAWRPARPVRVRDMTTSAARTSRRRSASADGRGNDRQIHVTGDSCQNESRRRERTPRYPDRFVSFRRRRRKPKSRRIACAPRASQHRFKLLLQLAMHRASRIVL